MKPAAQALDGKNSYGRDNTFGCHSNVVLVKEDFVPKTPGSLPAEAAARILCAGSRPTRP